MLSLLNSFYICSDQSVNFINIANKILTMIQVSHHLRTFHLQTAMLILYGTILELL